MTKSKNHNTIYFLTTISVYLGLVLVGASPHVLANAQLASDSQSRSFEFSSKTNNVFSKLKFGQKLDNEDVLSFPFVTSSKVCETGPNAGFEPLTSYVREFENIAANDHVFMVSLLPRASI